MPEYLHYLSFTLALLIIQKNLPKLTDSRLNLVKHQFREQIKMEEVRHYLFFLDCQGNLCFVVDRH